MATAHDFPLVPVEEYLNTQYPDGDREYLDGIVVERNVGTPLHSALQRILIAYLTALQKQFSISVLPECRTMMTETRYRVPDVVVMSRPYKKTDRAILDPPLLIIEILSPDDRTQETLRRFREYERRGTRYMVQMDPEDRTTFVFVNGDLIRRDLSSFELPDGRSLPFNSQQLLEELNEEQ
jgi:Uma2 family endonuclease